jgi:hypothetical protein
MPAAGEFSGDVVGWDSLPPTIPRPKSYGIPQNVQMINTECPYTAHGLSVHGHPPHATAFVCTAMRRLCADGSAR